MTIYIVTRLGYVAFTGRSVKVSSFWRGIKSGIVVLVFGGAYLLMSLATRLSGGLPAQTLRVLQEEVHNYFFIPIIKGSHIYLVIKGTVLIYS